RQHSLATLEQKRAFSEEVIESIQYALVITDNLGTIIHSNAATQHIFQKTPEILENANIRDLIKTKMPNELSQILSRCL
ncbi:PAS domain-containing protein, partial [Escherichia coli]|nr:PAS domain-containing protein [Escherichia coli]